MESRLNSLPNTANAFNLGINLYWGVKDFESMSNLSESHNDALKLSSIFKKELCWKGKLGSTVDIIDDKNT